LVDGEIDEKYFLSHLLAGLIGGSASSAENVLGLVGLCRHPLTGKTFR